MSKVFLSLIVCTLFACVNNIQKEIHSLGDAYNAYGSLSYDELTRMELDGQWIKPEVISFDLQAIIKNPPPFSIVDSTALIPLETRDNCLIGEIKKIVFKNQTFYVWDIENENLYAFNAEGHFKTQIGMQGRGPGEYRGIKDFTVSDEGDVYLVDNVQRKILVYNANGTFKRYIPLKDDGMNIQCREGRLILTSRPIKKNKAYRVKVIEISGENHKHYFHVDAQGESRQFMFNNLGYQANKEHYFLYFPQFSHQVYAINYEGKLEKNYFFSVMDMTTPPWLTLGTRTAEISTKGFNRIKEKYSTLSQIYDLDDYMVAEIRCSQILYIIHNKKTKHHEMVSVYNDYANQWPSSVFSAATIVGAKEGNTLIGYSTVSDLKMRQKLKKPYSFDFGPYNSLVSSLEEDANPVIMLTKIKMTDE